MLSSRALEKCSELDAPMRFVPAAEDRYHPELRPGGIVSLATAENTLMHGELARFASAVELPPAAFTYSYSSLGGPRLRDALAAHVNETFNPASSVTGSDIQVLDGATALHSVLAFALAEPGDAILASRPVYGRFELDFGNEHGVNILYADNALGDCLERTVVDAFQSAYDQATEKGTKIRAVLIVNPSNPLGCCYPRETLVEIMRFCQSHSMHLISDEIYALSVFGDHASANHGLPPFTSALSIDTQGLIDPTLVHVEYGTSKDFAAAGLRLGALITRNRDLQRAVRTVARFHEPSGSSVAVGAAMLENRAWFRSFIDLARRRIARAYDLATSKLREIGVKYLEANAGFFVFIDLSPWLPPAGEPSQYERECKLAEKLVEGGVFLHPGEEHALEPGWFRLVYTHPEEMMDEGFRRLRVALDAVPWQTSREDKEPLYRPFSLDAVES